MANENKRMSPDGRAALLHSEGVRREYYNDQGNSCTFGAGTLVHYGPCTAQEIATPPLSDKMIQRNMSSSIETAEHQVRSSVRGHELTQDQFDAAVSFAYNTGNTDALQPANAGQMSQVASRMRQYVYVCKHNAQGRRIPGTCRISLGLTNRRNREAAPFDGGTP